MKKVKTLLDQELSGQQAWRYAERIAQYNRIQASPGYREAAIQVVRLLDSAGVRVRLEDYPAQAGIRFLSRQSFQEWRCRGGELWLIEGKGKRRLCRYQEQELSLVQRSGPTPKGGVQAELVSVANAGKPESYQDKDVHGKIVLARGNPMTIYELAVREHGAIGLVFDNLSSYPPLRTRADLPDAIEYTSFWWSGKEQPCFGFCVSPRVGAELRDKLERGPLQLFAQVDSELVDGDLENVECFIPGRKQEEVLLVAHLCHPYPGAEDNASGPAVLMEVARTLARLLAQGDLAQPELGIRFLLVPEMTGTFAYFDRYPARIKTTVAAFNLDMVGADQKKGGGPLCIEEPPLATPTFLDRYALKLMDSVAQDVKNFNGTFGYSTTHYLPTPFSGGSDHYVISDPSIGIPCPMAMQWPDKHYHSSLDHPVNLDPQLMRSVGLMTALYAWGLAAGSEQHWLDFTASYLGDVAARLKEALARAFAAKAPPSQWRQVLAFRRDYELKSLDRLEEYADLRGFASLATAVSWGKEHTRRAAEHVQEWGAWRWGQLAATAAEKEALAPSQATKVYRRRYAGPLNMENELVRLPAQQRREWVKYAQETPTSPGYTTFLFYWLDGKRPLSEVLALVELESGAWHPEYALRYIALCQELGLVELIA